MFRSRLPSGGWLTLFLRSLTLPPDRDSPRLNLRLLVQFFRLTALYWGRRQAWRSHLALLTYLGYAIAEPVAGAFVARMSGEMLDALSKGVQPSFYSALTLMLGVQFAYSALFLLLEVPYSIVSIFWQRWLTRHFLADYLRARNYYFIERDSSVDNPDERIASDIPAFMAFPAQVLFDAVRAVSRFGVFGAVMWTYQGNLVLFCALWAVFGTTISLLVNRPVLNVTFVAKRLEGNFRFGLVHVRNHAESIALYGGEWVEERELLIRNDAIVANSLRFLFWNVVGRLWSAIYIALNQLIPILLLAPMLFAGKIGLAGYTELMAAWTNMDSAFAYFGVQVWLFANNGALVGRLWSLRQRCQVGKAVSPSSIHTECRAGGLELHQIELTLPGDERSLVTDLSLKLEAGHSLLVEGPSGCGKSTLVRAVAGLWESGHGLIERPPADQTMFLSQHPYTSLGSLAEQVAYPVDPGNYSEQQLSQALEAVGLGYLPDRLGGFAAEGDWANTLSPGERQRLAFARLLLRRPPFVILDEATSALDLPSEERAYQQLRALGCTYLSVGHRPTLRAFHEQALVLDGQGGWSLTTLRG